MRTISDHVHHPLPLVRPEIQIRRSPGHTWAVARARVARIAVAVRAAHRAGVPF